LSSYATAPTIAIACFALLLSVLARQSVAGVVGTIFYLLNPAGASCVAGVQGSTPYILVTQLHAWHAPFMTPTDWSLIGHAVWVSILYATPH
jgi:hypothetical protein